MNDPTAEFPYRVIAADGICIGTRRTEADARSLLRMHAQVLPDRGPYRIACALALPTGKVVTIPEGA